MIKLTVLYNLPPGAKSDFYEIKRAWRMDETPFRYMTEAYFPDMETFEKAFFDADYQAGLAESLERIADPLFLFSEEVISESSR